jgi:tetratricopeptide (TPR) repeat protein
LREAQVLAERAGDERRLGWALVHMGEPFRAAGEYRQSIDTAERALAIASAHGDAQLEVHARFHLGSCHQALGNFERAVEILEPNGRPPAIELFLGPTEILPPVTASIGLRAFALAQSGDFGAAMPLGEQAVRVAEQSGRPLHEVTGWNWLGTIDLMRGDVERAQSFLERAVGAARTYEIWFLMDRALVSLACTTAMAGRGADALALLRDVGTQGEGRSWLQPSATEGWRAEAYLHAERPEEAREAAVRALRIASSRSERPNEARAHLILGHVAASTGGPEAAGAELHYRNALSIAGDLGMRPLVAHCHLGLGKLYRRTGDRSQAQQHLTTATTMYRAMDMRFWLEQAAAETAT